jgi:WD40 repeat protein
MPHLAFLRSPRGLLLFLLAGLAALTQSVAAPAPKHGPARKTGPVRKPTPKPTAPKPEPPVAQPPASNVQQPTPILVPQAGHGGRITTLAYAPDGKTLASGAEDRTVRLWDTQSGELRAVLPGYTWAHYGVAFSPDSKLVAVASSELGPRDTWLDTIGVWDVRTGQLKSTLRGHQKLIWHLAFSPDGKILATASFDKTARLWDPLTGRALAVLEGHAGEVWWLAFSPDGTLLATGGGDKKARLWDVRTGTSLAVLEGHADRVGAVAFSPDGRTLATGSTDGTARLWDVRTRQLKATLPGHTNWVFLSFHPDGKTLLTRCNQRTFLWDTETGALKAKLFPQAPLDDQWALSPRWDLFALGHGGAQPQLWDLNGPSAQGQPKVTLGRHPAAVHPIIFSPDGKSLATGCADGGVRLWTAETGELRMVLSENGDRITAWAASTDGKTLAAGQANGTTLVWEAGSAQFKTILRNRVDKVGAVSITPDGRFVTTANEDGLLYVWDAQTGVLRSTLRREGLITSAGIDLLEGESWQLQGKTPDGHTWLEWSDLLLPPDQVKQIRVRLRVDKAADWLLYWRTEAYPGPDEGRRLHFNVPADGGFHDVLLPVGEHPLWKGQAITCLNIQPANNAPGGRFTLAEVALLGKGEERLDLTRFGKSELYRLASAPDGSIVSAAYRDGSVWMWNTASGQVRRFLGRVAADHSQNPGVGFSPDGRVLHTARDKTGVRFWDVETGQSRAPRVEGPGRPCKFEFAYSSDSKLLVTTGQDLRARVWDLEADRLVTTTAPHGGAVLCFAFSGDKKTLVTAGDDGTVRLWEVASGQLKTALTGYGETVTAVAYSPDEKTLATMTHPTGRRLLWDLRTARLIPTTSDTNWADFPQPFTYPLFEPRENGGALLDPETGRVRATLHAFSPAGNLEWCVVTPEGYFDCSANAGLFLRWNLGGQVYPAERYMDRFRRPDLVRKALRGEQTGALPLSGADVPPAVRFSGLKDGDSARGNPLPVGVEVSDDGEVKGVELLVNGRPLPPEQARPIEIGARPIEVGAKAIDPNHRRVQRFLFRVPLPAAAAELRLRAIARDSSDLLSEPVEIVLKTTSTQAGAGNLYVLAVGVSRYKQGGQGPGAGGRGIANLRYPALDARAVAERFGREGRPLYEKVEVRTLTDEEATLARLRTELKWLQGKVRPNQQDTVVLFLSGHGISLDGRYYFAPHELDPRNIAATGLSARELREALGGKLRARTVFLFVDTCHSGGLRGRNDDLALEVGEGVFLLASSGSREYSYESETWGHGAFTLSLLRALEQKTLARDGVIHFNALAHAVPDGVADLLKEAGRSESEQEPCVPLASRRLRVPLAQP